MIVFAFGASTPIATAVLYKSEYLEFFIPLFFACNFVVAIITPAILAVFHKVYTSSVILLSVFVVSAVSNVGLIFTESSELILVLRALGGLHAGSVGFIYAHFANLPNRSDRRKAVHRFESATLIAFAAAPAVVSIVLMAPGILPSEPVIVAVVVSASVLSVLCLTVFNGLSGEQTSTGGNVDVAQATAAPRNKYWWKRIWDDAPEAFAPVVALWFFARWLQTALVTLLPFLNERQDLAADKFISISMTLLAGSQLVIRMRIQSLVVDALGIRRSILLSVLLGAAAVMVFSTLFEGGSPGFFFFLFLFMLCAAHLNATASVEIVDLDFKGQATFLIGLANSVSAFGRLLGPISLGAILLVFPKNYLVAFCGTIAISAVLLVWWLGQIKRSGAHGV